MTGYFTLLKAIIKNSLRFDKKGKRSYAAAIAALLTLGLVFGSMTVGGVAFISPAFINAGLEAEFLTLLFAGTQVAVLLLGTASVVTVMFFSRDAEFVLALPVKPSALFFAKLTYLYLTDLLLSAFLVLTGGVPFGIIAGYGAYYFLMLLPVVLLLPVLPLLLSSLLSLPLMYIVGFFKRRGALAGIAISVMFALMLLAYTSFFGNLAQVEQADGLTFRLSAESAAAIRRAVLFVFPDLALSRLILWRQPLFNLAVFAGSHLALGLLAYFAASLAFRRGMSVQLEQPPAAKSGKKQLRTRSLRYALRKKDALEILRNPSLSFYCLFQLIFAPLMLVIMTFSGRGDPGYDIILSSPHYALGTAYFAAGFLSLSMNYTALSTLTREGANFPLLKTLPVSFRAQIEAKTDVARLLSAAGVAVTYIVSALMFPAARMQLLLLCGMLAVYGDGLSHFIAALDVKRPKFEYENITQALKNNLNSFTAMGVNLLFIVPVAVLYAAAALFSSYLTPGVAYGAFWILAYGAAALLGQFYRGVLYKNIEQRIAKLEI